jgi:hypothetical protein
MFLLPDEALRQAGTTGKEEGSVPEAHDERVQKQMRGAGDVFELHDVGVMQGIVVFGILVEKVSSYPRT